MWILQLIPCSKCIAVSVWTESDSQPPPTLKSGSRVNICILGCYKKSQKCVTKFGLIRALYSVAYSYHKCTITCLSVVSFRGRLTMIWVFALCSLWHYYEYINAAYWMAGWLASGIASDNFIILRCFMLLTYYTYICIRHVHNRVFPFGKLNLSV